MERIPVFSPVINESVIKHVEDAFKAGWLGMGSLTKEFEDRISDYLKLNDRFVATTNTGTAALHIALRVAGIGAGDEVITTSFNYVADHQAIRMSGANVVMADIRDDNLGIDCSKAQKLISKRTKAIMPLHFAGIPCDQKGVYDLAKKYNLRIIEDATHAFGTAINGRKIGSYGDIACFSFDPVKIITSIDGGGIVVNDKSELERAHLLRLLGVDKDTTERYKNRRAWEYDVISEGYRYHLNNVMASIGIAQIKKIDEFIDSRRTICKMYNEEFSKIDGVKTPQTDFENISPFIYSLRILDGKRKSLIKHLDQLGIDVGIHFIPVHKHSYFRNSICGDMSVTNRVANEILTLPLHSMMNLTFVERVIKGVKSFFKN